MTGFIFSLDEIRDYIEKEIPENARCQAISMKRCFMLI